MREHHPPRACFNKTRIGGKMCPKKNFLVIGGGVGPAAGVMFHDKIVDLVNNRNLKDQGHAPVIHLSMSPYVLDRTRFLKNEIQDNPGINMALAVKAASESFGDSAGDFVVGVPCNTFHSKRVFNAYRAILSHPRIHLIHMINETADAIPPTPLAEGGEIRPKTKVILLSTRGTRDTNVYDEGFTQDGKPSRICINGDEAGNRNKDIILLKCNGESDENDGNLSHFFPGGAGGALGAINNDLVVANQQGAVMAAIYDGRHGVKGRHPDYRAARQVFERVVERLVRTNGGGVRGEDQNTQFKVIMGCTEIPIAYKKEAEAGRGDNFLNADQQYLDPMDVLGKKMIDVGGYPLSGVDMVPMDAIQIDPNNHDNAFQFTKNMFPLSKL
ncbi:MAG: hypothetical protein ABJN51_08235 [Sneathiella sp.]